MPPLHAHGSFSLEMANGRTSVVRSFTNASKSTTSYASHARHAPTWKTLKCFIMRLFWMNGISPALSVGMMFQLRVISPAHTHSW